MDKLARVEYFALDELSVDELSDRIRQAVNTLEDLQPFDTKEGRQYAIDQAVRLLLKDKYGRWKDARPDWSEGAVR